MKVEAERREWEEEDAAAAPQRRASREEGPCERIREEEEEAEARRRRAGEATIISFDIGLMILVIYGGWDKGKARSGRGGANGLPALEGERQALCRQKSYTR